MKLAVKKEPSAIPGTGFHYMMFPNKMDDPTICTDARVFALMDYIIIEVDDAKGEELLQAARKALGHQIEVAFLAEEALCKQK